MNETLSVLQHTLQASVSPYHCIMEASRQLEEAGFQPLTLTGTWNLKEEQGYYLPVFDSSLMAFTIGRQNGSMPSLRMEAAHTDWPCLKLKPSPEVATGHYGKLNVEVYGGPILNTWMDRPLSMSGKVCIAGSDPFTPDVRFINFKRPLLTVPNLAIHMNREMNKGVEYNPQVDLLPLLADVSFDEYDAHTTYDAQTASENAEEQPETVEKPTLAALAAETAGVDAETILGEDLFLYTRQEGKMIGAKGEFVLSPRLDDLQSAFALAKAFTESTPAEYINVCAVFDNEEVGSGTRQGADSTFLEDTLQRIAEGLQADHSSYLRWVADSFLISADNAHAVHPNHPEKADPTNRPYLNGGIVIKYHGSQKYTTDGISAARMKDYCERAKVPYQTYANRSDIAGGSTLGNISTAHVSVSSVDIGLPQLAMHSAVETAGMKDTEYAVRALKEFWGE